MANRINKNLRWVKRQLDLAKMSDVVEEEILDAMSYAELEIMERTGSVKLVSVVTFNSLLAPVAPVNQGLGIYAFPVGADRIVYMQTPPAWSRPLLVTEDPVVFDAIQKANIGGTQPLVAYVANNLITFWPLPTDGQTVTIFSFRIPTDAEQQVEGVGDPILTRHWDLVLRYMALNTLMPATKWHDLAEEEYNREAHHHIQETGAPIQVDHSSNRLGF